MVLIKNSLQSLGSKYPKNTGRLKQIIGNSKKPSKKVALLGDSTIDNGYWVDTSKSYADKTHTVTHQTAIAIASNDPSSSFDIGNFAVDGATTTDLMRDCLLNKVLPRDADHTSDRVHQLKVVTAWKPDVVVVSVAGSNYREALASTLTKKINFPQLLLRITPEHAKSDISSVFQHVKEKLVEDYKRIIDQLTEQNAQLSRIVLLSQYYPSITEFTPYFIYTGFSHLARSEGKGRAPFTVVEETMNEIYRETLAYAATKEKEIVFVDVTSSLNPLGGKHSHQIEPNEKASVIIGRLIAKAVQYNFPKVEIKQDKKPIVRLYMDADEKQIHSQLLRDEGIKKYSVKKVEQFISENRYRHLGLLFSPSSSLGLRYESAYYAIMGKQFDTEYTGLFAFGLLDLTLVPVMASYFWHIAMNENIHTAFRVIAGSIAAPILLSKMILGLSLMLALALPVFGYNKVMNYFSKIDNIQNQEKFLFETDESILAI